MDFLLRVEDYFEINDYIKGSIDEIVWLAIFVALGWGLGYLEEVTGIKKKSVMWPCIFLVVFSILAVYSFISDCWLRYYSLFFVFYWVVLVLDNLMLRVNLDCYEKIKFYISRSLHVLMLCALLYVDGKNTALVKMQPDYQPKQVTRILINNKLMAKPSGLLFLGSNSKYGFFYNKTTNESMVIPLEEIKCFKISPIKKSSTPQNEK